MGTAAFNSDIQLAADCRRWEANHTRGQKEKSNDDDLLVAEEVYRAFDQNALIIGLMQYLSDRATVYGDMDAQHLIECASANYALGRKCERERNGRCQGQS